MNNKIKGASVDAIALTFVRIVTLLISMVTYKLLAVTFSVEDYGTYASATLVSTTVISLTILGLTDAINYFYAKDRNVERGKVYVYTIFAIQFVIGVAVALILIILKDPIAVYFKNPSVAALIPAVAFLPLLTNFANMLHVVFITAKKAKVIAIRNFIISVLKIIMITAVCLLSKKIYLIIVITLILELGNVIYMLLYCKKYIFRIDITKANPGLVKEILCYSIPMAAYILTNSLSKNMDKLVIGALGSSQMVGMYSIASKELPFDILTASFLTVLVPYITRYMGDENFPGASALFSKYIQLTYLITWIVAGGALVCSKELMRILYDQKYLSALSIFCMYIVVDMLKFANVSIIFSISNKAKELLCYSGAALLLNGVLNIVLFKMFGMPGPAIATIIVTVLLSCVITFRSSQLLKVKVSALLNLKQLIFITCEYLVFGILAFGVKFLLADKIPTLLTFMITYGIYAVPLLAINRKKIVSLLKVINKAELT